jgi:hypothetical protein
MSEFAARLDSFAYNWVYDGVIVGGAISCLVRGLLGREDRSAWLDGAIAAITAAGVVAALAFDPISGAARHSDPAAATTNFA